MAQNQTHHHPPQLSSNYALPIFAILIVFILITYFILVTKCCLKFHPLRWISILPPSQDEDPFIAFSPTIRNRGGVDESIIQKIPTFQFTKGDGDEYDHQSVKGCVVCLSSFQEQDMLKVLPNCSHYFHLDCINIWLQTNSNCPLCRTSISGNTQVPMEHIIAPSSSPQESQLFSNMGSDEDFVVIELWGEGEHGGTTVPQIQQESRNDSTKMEEKKNVNLKQKKWKRVSCIMDDECIDVRRKDDQFCVETIRRSFSLDSANDRQVYLDVQDIIQHNHRSQNEDCDSSRGRRSFFPLCYGRGMGSKPALLAPHNRVKY
ncbi:RING-H2 finger protein ATL16-like [Cicer arietinum]|uniref:RING-type E3 ubiquitin transferase n=1 Tax=Cicer arietinum TaxID=3827 RepID=A0A1S2XSI8_CICAR|nr:RING-H2 finger protein ATL16-like [Cicer arietinum]